MSYDTSDWNPEHRSKSAIRSSRQGPIAVTSLTDFHVRLLSEPRPYPITYLTDNSLYPMLISGIVNPYGPTLSVVTAVRDRTSAPLALVYAYLNPFRSELFIPGYLMEGQLTAPLPDQILQALHPFPVFSGGLPTLCIPAGYLDAFDVRYLYRRLFANHGAARTTLERLRRFPLNPWDRVSEEVQEFWSGGTGERIQHADNVDGPISDDDMNSLIDMVLDPQHNKEELPAFTYAWSGSIDHQKRCENNRLADSAFQYDDFVRLLVHILSSAGWEPE